MTTLALVGVNENDINLFDFKRIDRTLNDFHYGTDDSELKQSKKN